MKPNTSTVRHNGQMDSDLVKGTVFDLLPWCPSDTSYADSMHLGEPRYDYFPLRSSSASAFPDPGAALLHWTTFPGVALSTIGCGEEGSVVSPGPWAGDSESEGCDLFSPITADLASVNSGSVTHIARSPWSEQASARLSPSPHTERIPIAGAKRGRAKAYARQHGIQLRTAPRKPRRPSVTAASHSPDSDNKGNRSPPTDEDDLTPEERRARRNHNLVEKQYRNRLNAQFERLLAVLPVDECRTRAGGMDRVESSGADEKRMSKAEVLDLATRRIRTLEVERNQLLRERRELLRNIEAMMAGAVGARPGIDENLVT
ncbi:hypothetical protein C8A03DRAFT_46159 [Achaetomium macrosporum]|uniref:BHLH domain-containing protein n=1 Tax=Achaetomium macrosporum TaxID=79813 RepID=A0AAN7C5R3_9PEZI|nr:hypothetical protein C8A03DRAFT_46159 [Achaetomium macrosporum]